MSVWEGLLLGLIQGLTEFLPVSSSGHLLLTEKLLGIESGNMLFEIIVHVATLIAVAAVFYKDIWRLIKNPFGKEMRLLVVASMPTAIIFFAFERFFRDSFSGAYLGYGFLVTGVLLLATDFLGGRFKKKQPVSGAALAEAADLSVTNGISKTCGQKQKKRIRSLFAGSGPLPLNNMKYGSVLGMGIAQGIAVLPGISRSGATVCTGLILGVDRPTAARFSFLMSLPIILGSLILELVQNGSQLSGAAPAPIIAGFIAAAVTGYIAVRFMLHIITKKRFWGFSVYLFALGAFVLINNYALHLF